MSKSAASTSMVPGAAVKIRNRKGCCRSMGWSKRSCRRRESTRELTKLTAGGLFGESSHNNTCAFKVVLCLHDVQETRLLRV